MVQPVQKASVGKSVRSDCCHRCGGLMVQERVFESGSVDWRCVSCGERIDAVILEHRRQQLARGEGGHLFVRHGKSSLN